jgi:Flp pilus assembly protein TadB
VEKKKRNRERETKRAARKAEIEAIKKGKKAFYHKKGDLREIEQVRTVGLATPCTKMSLLVLLLLLCICRH